MAGPTPNQSQWGLDNFDTVLRSRHFFAWSLIEFHWPLFATRPFELWLPTGTAINSLVFAAASAALALVIGWVTAWIVERTNAPLKGLAYVTAIISLGTPYILYVTAWLLFFGKAGLVTHLYRTLPRSTAAQITFCSIY